MTVILDGTGNAYKAKVGSDHRLRTYSKSASIQHVESEANEQAYQVIGLASLAATTVSVLHITNNDASRLMIVTYIRHQVIGASGGTAFPNESNYFQVGLGRTYNSGGSEAIPVNVSSGSGNTANIIAYQGGPTLDGTIKEIDRWYTKSDGDMNTFNKEGALIIQPNNTMEISYTGNHTSGGIYGRISFIMGD